MNIMRKNGKKDHRKNILQYLYLSNPEELKGLAETGLQEEAVTFTFSPVWTGFVNLDYGFRFRFAGRMDAEQVDVSERVLTGVNGSLPSRHRCC